MSLFQAQIEIRAHLEDEILEYIDSISAGLSLSGYSTNYEPKQNKSYLNLYYKDEEIYIKEKDIIIEGLHNFDLPNYEYKTNTLDEEIYLNSYKEYLSAYEIDDILRIVPAPHLFNEQNSDDKINIFIDAKYAFGTGTHPTTFLVLEHIARYVRKNIKKLARILDIGVGSGILSIASYKLGYKNITAIDIDDDAIKCARENALYNEIDDITLSGASLNSYADSEFDLIFMNIETSTLLTLIDGAVSALAAHGTMILSGILTERANEVLEYLNDYNIKIVSRTDKDDWTSLIVLKV